MKKGSIILSYVPQADGKAKLRPSLVLCSLPPHNDILVCGVSSQIHQCVNGFDEIINQTDIDFKTSGLTKSSLIRLGFLAVFPRKKIAGPIGSISDERHKRLLFNLANYLLKENKNK